MPPISATYRIELLRFTGMNDEQATSAMAETFGISTEQARRYVIEAPIVVRSGVSSQEAGQFAQALIRIGADLRISSEQTGEERTYHAAQVEPTELTTGALADEVSSGVHRSQELTPQAPQDVTCPKCGFRQAADTMCAACGLVFAKYVERRREAAVLSSDVRATPSGPLPAVMEKLTHSPSRAVSAVTECPSCGRGLPEPSRMCRFCGWDADRNARRCKRCGATVELSGSAKDGRTLGMALAILGGAAGLVVGFRWGLLGASAVIAGVGAMGCVSRFFTTTYRCVGCGTEAQDVDLGNAEARLLRRRRFALLGAAVVLVTAAALIGSLSFGPRYLEHTSETGRFSVRLPDSHRSFETRAQRMTTSIGNLTATRYEAENHEEHISSYLMVHLSLPPGLDRQQTDELLEAVLRSEVASTGSRLTETNPVRYRGFQGLEGRFEGFFQRADLYGKLRIYRFPDELVMVGFAGSRPQVLDSPVGERFLQSLQLRMNE